MQSDVNGANVFSIFKSRSVMITPLISQVEAYWQGLCPDGDIPHRSDISPRGLLRALDHTFILSRGVPRTARLRLSCTQLDDLMGMDTRGMVFTSFFNSSDRRQIQNLVENLFLTPQVITFQLRGPSFGPSPGLPAQLVLMPLRDDYGDITRALGCFVANGIVETIPQRFRIKSVNCRLIDIQKAPEEVQKRPAKSVLSSSGFSDPAAIFTRATAQRVVKKRGPSDGRPVLRLVKSDD